MKRIKDVALLACFLTGILSGCKKDNNESDAGFLGKWYVIKISFTEYENGVKTEEQTETGFNSDDYIDFKKDGSGIADWQGTNDDDDDRYPYKFTYTYDISAKKITLTGSDEEHFIEEYIIKTLTSNQLVLFSDRSANDENNVIHRQTIEVILKR